MNLSGCTSSESTSDLRTYTNFNPTTWGLTPTSNGIYNGNVSNLTWSGISCSDGGGRFGPTCVTPNSNVITYEKGVFGSIGEFRITCDTFSDFNDFYTTYNSVNSSFSGSPFDNTSIDYYRAFTIFVPNPLTVPCGDGVGFRDIPIHYSSVVTTGGTGPWFINFTMPLVTSGITFDACDQGCTSSLNNIVSAINNASTGTSNNFTGTTTTGSRYTNFTSIQYNYLRLFYNNNIFTAQTIEARVRLHDYQYQTIPWSGISNTLIPSLSGQSCNITGITRPPSGQYYDKYQYYYQVFLTDPLDRTSFDIYASPITNGLYSGYPSNVFTELAVSFVGNSLVYSNPAYTI